MSLCTNPKPDYRPPGVDRHEELNQIPIWERYLLTIKEAAAYFRIGENKLRQIIDEHKDETFILRNGTKTLIKRKLFEEYIDRCEEV